MPHTFLIAELGHFYWIYHIICLINHLQRLNLSIGTMIPKSGGDYAYISEAFGELPGFLYLWSALIMIMPAGNAIISLTFANNVLQPFFADCAPPDNAVRLLAATIICKSNFSKIYLCKAI